MNWRTIHCTERKYEGRQDRRRSDAYRRRESSFGIFEFPATAGSVLGASTRAEIADIIAGLKQGTSSTGGILGHFAVYRFNVLT